MWRRKVSVCFRSKLQRWGFHLSNEFQFYTSFPWIYIFRFHSQDCLHCKELKCSSTEVRERENLLALETESRHKSELQVHSWIQALNSFTRNLLLLYLLASFLCIFWEASESMLEAHSQNRQKVFFPENFLLRKVPDWSLTVCIGLGKLLLSQCCGQGMWHLISSAVIWNWG